MSALFIIGTRNGLAIYKRKSQSWHELHRGLVEHEVTSVIARQGVILAGTRKGIFRSEDLGQSWQNASLGLDIPYVRWLAFHPEISDLEFAGTEPAGIFVSRDRGGSWQSCPDISRLRDAQRWSLPYSPAAGCIRGFAFHGQRVYAAAEVGGALRSDDGGNTWALANGDSSRPYAGVNQDVHSIAVHAASPELVYAPTGGGFYRSWDGGRRWKNRYRCYCRAVWVDAADAEHMILGPADHVDRGGRIEESQDGGNSWTPANTGLDTPWSRHMVERFFQAGDELLAVLSNGELLAAALATLEWRRALPQVGQVSAVAWMSEGGQ